ncbi:MAG: phosphoribosylanthranilate isomerase [Parvularculaceae bacterium]|nr:phosphoribosylanthranilate isomerase [Parvularculaceae bacterium]
MRTRVKICCISSLSEARLAIREGADALGLVGAMPTGVGVIPDDQAALIASAVPPPVTAISLTSATTAEGMARQIQHVGAPCVQVVQHGDPNVLFELRELLPAVRIIQVIHVEGEDALELISRYEDVADAFLLDSGRPSSTDPALGGTGRVHDWSVSASFVTASPLPVFLAGGLSPDNVAEAIRRVRPFGLDACSRLRTNDQLDQQKLRAFMTEIRKADVGLAQA